jgi:CheY-like chemotaxis protein
MSTILVIDDEPDILENIIDLLEANAYQTLAASDPEQGIDLAQAHQPDLEPIPELFVGR